MEKKSCRIVMKKIWNEFRTRRDEWANSGSVWPKSPKRPEVNFYDLREKNYCVKSSNKGFEHEWAHENIYHIPESFFRHSENQEYNRKMRLLNWMPKKTKSTSLSTTFIRLGKNERPFPLLDWPFKFAGQSGHVPRDRDLPLAPIWKASLLGPFISIQ